MRTRERHRGAAPARRQRGFSLVEMLIVVAVLGILASITVPTFVARRITANEAAILGTMRAISQAQFQFRAQNSVDTNGDMGSEYGSLGELAGLDPLRGQTAPLTLRLLSVNLGALDSHGHIIVHGYRLALYLPDAAGAGVVATLANRPLFEPVRARDYYTCLAWPIAVDVTGHRAFFVNQQGQVMKTLLAHYSGLHTMPAPGAALQGTSGPTIIESQTLATSGPGADGLAWTAVN